MNRLDQVDVATGGPFRVLSGGVNLTAANPVDLAWQVVAMALEEPQFFLANVINVDVSSAVLKRLMESWRVHYDLPTFDETRRLALAIERYHDALEWDLYEFCRVDLGNLWRRRKWRLLLNLIDKLPVYSLYSQMMANDDDYTKALAEQLKLEDESPSSGRPPLRGFTPVVSTLQLIVNELRAFRNESLQIHSGKNSTIPKPHFLDSPDTAYSRAIRELRERQTTAEANWLRATFLPTSRDRDDRVDGSATEEAP